MTALPAACRDRVFSLAVQEMSWRKETPFQTGLICERLFSSEKEIWLAKLKRLRRQGFNLNTQSCLFLFHCAVVFPPAKRLIYNSPLWFEGAEVNCSNWMWMIIWISYIITFIVFMLICLSILQLRKSNKNFTFRFFSLTVSSIFLCFSVEFHKSPTPQKN